MELLPSVILYKQEFQPQDPEKHYISPCLGHTLPQAPLSSVQIWEPQAPKPSVFSAICKGSGGLCTHSRALEDNPLNVEA